MNLNRLLKADDYEKENDTDLGIGICDIFSL